MAAEPARLALVIGNASYAEQPLRNPINDARAIAGALKKVGFDVTTEFDLPRRRIGTVIEGFARKIGPGDTVVIFYAGHGVQIRGENYLAAVDAEMTTQYDVALNSISVSGLLDRIDEMRAGVKVLFLDACRDNPFTSVTRSAAGGSRGLARMGTAAPRGTLISFATRPGGVAADGDGSNGLYTTALLKHIMRANRPVELMLKDVSGEVVRMSNGEQEPWTEGSIRGEFVFSILAALPLPSASATVLAPVAVPTAGMTPPSSGTSEFERLAWAIAEGERSTEAYEGFLKEYPSSAYAPLARMRLSSLTKRTPATVPAVPPAGPQSPVESPVIGAAVLERLDASDWRLMLANAPHALEIKRIGRRMAASSDSFDWFNCRTKLAAVAAAYGSVDAVCTAANGGDTVVVSGDRRLLTLVGTQDGKRNALLVPVPANIGGTQEQIVQGDRTPGGAEVPARPFPTARPEAETAKAENLAPWAEQRRLPSESRDTDKRYAAAKTMDQSTRTMADATKPTASVDLAVGSRVLRMPGGDWKKQGEIDFGSGAGAKTVTLVSAETGIDRSVISLSTRLRPGPRSSDEANGCDASAGMLNESYGSPRAPECVVVRQFTRKRSRADFVGNGGLHEKAVRTAAGEAWTDDFFEIFYVRTTANDYVQVSAWIPKNRFAGEAGAVAWARSLRGVVGPLADKSVAEVRLPAFR